MNWHDIVVNIVLPAFGTILTGLIGWAATRFNAASGIKIEQAQREALHRAIMTGIQAAILKYGPNASNADLVTHAISYATSSVPDAILALNPSNQVLGAIAASKITEVKGNQ